VADAGAIRHVLEPAISEIAIERAAGRVRIVGSCDGQRVHEVDVRQPVVVDVQSATPPLIDSTMNFFSGAA
jgi:hypothetical protein